MTAGPSVAVAIQARTGSRRLPGKVLASLAGRPMLRLQLDRLAPLATDHQLVVATSDLPGDDAVADLAHDAGADVVRGPEADVLARFALVIERYEPDTVIRLTGDCPLSDPAVVAAVLALHQRTNADYTSNVHPRSFPKGLDVEVARASALQEAAERATEPEHREHVTPYLWEPSSGYRRENLSSGRDLGHLWWTVDTADDLEAVRALVAPLDDPVRAGWVDILATAPSGERT